METKEAAFHDAVGLPLEARVVAALAQAGLAGQALAQRIVLQSFEEQVGRVTASSSVSTSLCSADGTMDIVLKGKQRR